MRGFATEHDRDGSSVLQATRRPGAPFEKAVAITPNGPPRTDRMTGTDLHDETSKLMPYSNL